MKINNLKKTYDQKVVLNIENLDFEEGKIHAIIGANGCGKSTLLRIIAGTVKADSKTKIDFLGKDYCYMPQKNHAFKMSTEKNLFVSAKRTEENKKKAAELMKELKLDALAKSPAHKLSGGETAKMALIRTVLSGAEILLLDEPTAAMDIESTLCSEEIIKRYNKEKNATIIIVTHSLSQARRIADNIILLKDGIVVEKGIPEKVLNNPTDERTKEFLNFFSLDK